MKRIYILFITLALAVSSFAFKDQSTKLKESMARGKDIYDGSCTVCHLGEGQGIPGVFPPLAKSDYLMNDLNTNIKNMIDGLSGEIEVNGVKYNGVMQPSGLDDADIADVLNYIRNSWGNEAKKSEFVTAEMVAKVRNGE